MLDTATIFFEFSSKYYYDMAYANVDRVAKLHKDKREKYKNKNVYVTFKLAHLGFKEVLFFRQEKENYRYYEMSILTRFKMLVNDHNYINVINASEIENALERFNFIIKMILELDLPDVIFWKVRRIDFAIDIMVPEEIIPVYLALFKKANIPEDLLNDPRASEWFNEENNFYLISKNYTINFYQRYLTQLKRQEAERKAFINIEGAKNLFRFEIQMHNTERMKKKGMIINRKLWNFLDPKLLERTIGRCFDLYIGSGDYYKSATAVQIIKDKISDPRQQWAMLRVVYRIRDSGSIWAAKGLYSKSAKDDKNRAKENKKFSQRLNEIRKLGINPVPLQDDFSKDKLDGLYEAIHKHLRGIQISASNLFETRERNAGQI